MAAFEDAAIVAPALNIDQVRGALVRSGWDEPVDDATLGRALAALVEWSHLDVTQDHGGHYATPEEFERKNLQWSVTRRGEAAIGTPRVAGSTARVQLGPYHRRGGRAAPTAARGRSDRSPACRLRCRRTREHAVAGRAGIYIT